MSRNTQEFPAISGSDVQRAPDSAAAEQAATRHDADEREAATRSVAVLGYN